MRCRTYLGHQRSCSDCRYGGLHRDRIDQTCYGKLRDKVNLYSVRLGAKASADISSRQRRSWMRRSNLTILSALDFLGTWTCRSVAHWRYALMVTQVNDDGLVVQPTAFYSFECVSPLRVSGTDHSLCRLLGVLRCSGSVKHHWPAA